MTEPYSRIAYISAPLRVRNGAHGPFTPYHLARNTARAAELAQSVWQAGWVAICPHLNTLNFDGLPGLESDAYIKGDCTMISRLDPDCDLVFVGLGWELSKGCIAEIYEAGRHSIPVVYESFLNAVQETVVGWFRRMRDKSSAAYDLLVSDGKEQLQTDSKVR